MEENIEEKLIKICEKWITLAITKGDSEKIKHIFAVMDTIGGTKILKYITEAKEFLSTLKQTDEVKEVIDYVENGKTVDRGLPLF